MIADAQVEVPHQHHTQLYCTVNAALGSCACHFLPCRPAAHANGSARRSVLMMKLVHVVRRSGGLLLFPF